MSSEEKVSLPEFREAFLRRGTAEPEIPYLYARYRESKALDGIEFVEGHGARVPAVWGQGGQVLWAEGEPTMIFADPGLGKTTIAQQVALARIRGGEEVLGFPVEQERRRVLYVAADRPRQSARSLRRMVLPGEEDLLREKLTVLPRAFELGADLEFLVKEAEAFDAGTVFIDTLGAVMAVANDESGLRFYHVMQRAMEAGIEVMVLHHSRKRGEHLRGLDEVYGSRWLTAGMGSVIYLSADYSDENAAWFRHLKTPAEQIRNCKVIHDHQRGRSYREGQM